MWLSIQIAAYAIMVLGYALLLVLAIRSRAGRERARQLLETVLLLAALWTLGLGLLGVLTSGSWWDFVWHRTAEVGLVILAMHTANFADVFAHRPPRRWLRIGAVALLVLVAIVLDAFSSSLAIDLAPTPSIRLGASQLATALLFSAWLVVSATAWWTCVTAFRHAAGAKHRNRIRYLGAALLGFAAGDLLILLDGTSNVYIGLVARLIGFSIAAFAVLRYDLPDIRQLTLTGIRVALLSGLTACLYLAGLLLAAWASGAVADLSQPLVVGLAIGLALLIVAIVDVTLGPRLHRILDRAILGEQYNIQRALRLHSEEINLILDLERLADTTLDWVRTSLGVERSAFILFTALRHGQTQLRVLRSTSPPPPPPMSFAPESRFVTHFHRIGRPLSQYDLDMLSWFQSMPQAEHRWLKALAADLYVPVLAPDKCVALLALGPKASEQPYSDEDLETLMILAGQTGTALANARLLDDLRAVQGDLHRLSTELSETNRQLQRLDQTKTDFITIASHELRTPLTQISGYSEILGKLQADELTDAPVVRDFIDGISQGALRLKHVVDAMVDVSLIETSALRLRPTTLALDAFVKDAIDKVQPAITARSQNLSLGDLSGLPEIQADKDRFGQVLVSLLTNAIKFTPDGGEVSVSGRLIQSGSDKGFVELQVADGGIGIDPEHRGLIFEKFYRPENPMLHSTDTRGFKGAGPGLGLAIAKGIVIAHGGRIWVESPGRDEKTCPGSTFFVRLPVAGPGKD
jgi:signal transduction histidine kinase